MTFSDLEDFIKHRMRMSHIYQPVMLKVAVALPLNLRRDAFGIEFCP